MAHWRKRNAPARRFSAYLAGWALAFSVISDACDAFASSASLILKGAKHDDKLKVARPNLKRFRPYLYQQQLKESEDAS